VAQAFHKSARPVSCRSLSAVTAQILAVAHHHCARLEASERGVNGGNCTVQCCKRGFLFRRKRRSYWEGSSGRGGSSFNEAVSDASERIAFEHKATPEQCPTLRIRWIIICDTIRLAIRSLLVRHQRVHSWRLKLKRISGVPLTCSSTNDPP
jgi:hypothetical protein